MPKGKEKSAAYRALGIKYGFREYDFYQFIRCLRAGVRFRMTDTPAQMAEKIKGCKGYIGTHLDAHTVMAMGKRAFMAVQRAIFTGGRARFCRKDEFRSVQGINRESAINWNGSAVTWSGLAILSEIDLSDAVIKHGVESPLRSTRIVRMAIRGRERWFVQLTSEGAAYKKAKHSPAAGIVGLDLGPSTIAVVGAKSATVERFCDELGDTEKAIATAQRAEDRSRRAMNPDNFNPNKTIKPRKQRKAWKRSKRMIRLAAKRADLQRKEKAHRKNLHGKLVHRVLSLGNDVRTEKLSYKGFQRSFGRSSRTRAPGMFVARLRTEAEKWGATVTEFDARKTMLSQTCPKCGTLRKKKLSEREHQCSCGCTGHRDIISAYLATHVAGGRLDTASASKGWRGLCNVLRAVSGDKNAATGAASAVVHGGRNRRQSTSHENMPPMLFSVGDVVTPCGARAPEKTAGEVLTTASKERPPDRKL